MNSALVPGVLYKYRDDSKRTEDIFRDRKVWLSLPDQLNDPFECRAGQIPDAWKSETLRQLEQGQLMGMIGPPLEPVARTLFSLNRRQTNRWLRKLKKLSHRERMVAMRKLYLDHGIELSRPELIFDDMRKRLNSVGVFSLSVNCDNELMWAHYGQDHRGLAIGFDRQSHCKLGSSRHVLQVNYSSQKPTFEVGFKNEVTFYATPNGGIRSEARVSFEDDVFRASLSTKTPPWSYEDEWRYVEESHGLFDWPGNLSQVVFGLRMPPDRRQHYKDVVREFVGNAVKFFAVEERRSLPGLEIKPE